MAFDIMQWLFGSTPEMQQTDLMTPGQQGMQQQVLGGLQQPTGSGLEYLQSILSGDPGAFSQFEAPMMRQFEQEIIPGISERFAGMGTGGAQDSSAFQQTLGRAGTELSTNLAGMRAGLKSQAMQQLQGLMGIGQQKAFQPTYDPGSYGLLGGMAQGVGQGAGKAGMQAFLA